MSLVTPEVAFRKHDRIGANDADEDAEFLEDCFIDTGALELLRDCKKPQRVVLGRTGTGKSALLLKLRMAEPRAIEVKPENLALSYISNSNILQFFEGIGVNLEPFYKLIWRHAFCVELLRSRFGVTAQDQFSLFDKLRAALKGTPYLAAIKYLEHWGDKFWEQTEARVREVTEKIEQSLKGSVAGGVVGGFSADGAKALTREQREEVVHRAQRVVHEAQVPQLNQLLDVVCHVLDDEQKRYFIVIDRLEENWVDDRLRYKLIMALLENVKEFKRVRNAKIIVALRIDLLQRVFARGRTSGLQEEKFDSLFLNLRWTEPELKQMIDARVNRVFRARYSKNRVLSASDILVDTTREKGCFAYMLERSFGRPRDVICFFNECIDIAAGHTKIALRDVKKAESAYSRDRLKALADEWRVEFPNLMPIAKGLLRGVRLQGKLGVLIAPDELDAKCLALHDQNLEPDELRMICMDVLESKRPCFDLLYAACAMFFRVGIIGVKPAAAEAYAWHADGGRGEDVAPFGPDTMIKIHPMFCRALSVEADSRS